MCYILLIISRDIVFRIWKGARCWT